MPPCRLFHSLSLSQFCSFSLLTHFDVWIPHWGTSLEAVRTRFCFRLEMVLNENSTSLFHSDFDRSVTRIMILLRHVMISCPFSLTVQINKQILTIPEPLSTFVAWKKALMYPIGYAEQVNIEFKRKVFQQALLF